MDIAAIMGTVGPRDGKQLILDLIVGCLLENLTQEERNIHVSANLDRAKK